jgi:hypothetical protein
VNDSNIQRIEFLKRENRRSKINKMMDKFSVGDFLSQKENDFFCKKIYSKLSMINQVEINECSLEANILKSKQIIEQVKIHDKLLEKKARFLVSTSFEVEAVSVNPVDIINNVEFASEVCGFNDGMFDFMLVAEDLSYGVCIERGEYAFYKLFWGLM